MSVETPPVAGHQSMLVIGSGSPYRSKICGKAAIVHEFCLQAGYSGPLVSNGSGVGRRDFELLLEELFDANAQPNQKPPVCLCIFMGSDDNKMGGWLLIDDEPNDRNSVEQKVDRSLFDYREPKPWLLEPRAFMERWSRSRARSEFRGRLIVVIDAPHSTQWLKAARETNAQENMDIHLQVVEGENEDEIFIDRWMQYTAGHIDGTQLRKTKGIRPMTLDGDLLDRSIYHFDTKFLRVLHPSLASTEALCERVDDCQEAARKEQIKIQNALLACNTSLLPEVLTITAGYAVQMSEALSLVLGSGREYIPHMVIQAMTLHRFLRALQFQAEALIEPNGLDGQTALAAVDKLFSHEFVGPHSKPPVVFLAYLGRSRNSPGEEKMDSLVIEPNVLFPRWLQSRARASGATLVLFIYTSCSGKWVDEAIALQEREPSPLSICIQASSSATESDNSRIFAEDWISYLCGIKSGMNVAEAHSCNPVACWEDSKHVLRKHLMILRMDDGPLAILFPKQKQSDIYASAMSELKAAGKSVPKWHDQRLLYRAELRDNDDQVLKNLNRSLSIVDFAQVAERFRQYLRTSGEEWKSKTEEEKKALQEKARKRCRLEMIRSHLQSEAAPVMHFFEKFDHDKIDITIPSAPIVGQDVQPLQFHYKTFFSCSHENLIGTGFNKYLYRGNTELDEQCSIVHAAFDAKSRTDSLIREFQWMTTHHHARIVRYHGFQPVVGPDRKNKVVFVLEPMDVSISDMVRQQTKITLPSSLVDRVKIMIECARAVDVLHTHFKLVHRNIGPSSFLVNLALNGTIAQIKIWDLALAEAIDEPVVAERSVDIVMTDVKSSASNETSKESSDLPAAKKLKPDHDMTSTPAIPLNNRTRADDILGLSAVFYELLTGGEYLEYYHKYGLYGAIPLPAKRRYWFPPAIGSNPAINSSSLKSLLNSMAHADSKQRPTITAVIACLEVILLDRR